MAGVLPECLDILPEEGESLDCILVVVEEHVTQVHRHVDGEKFRTFRVRQQILNNKINIIFNIFLYWFMTSKVRNFFLFNAYFIVYLFS